jgi:hypothetical protein
MLLYFLVNQRGLIICWHNGNIMKILLSSLFILGHLVLGWTGFPMMSWLSVAAARRTRSLMWCPITSQSDSRRCIPTGTIYFFIPWHACSELYSIFFFAGKWNYISSLFILGSRNCGSCLGSPAVLQTWWLFPAPFPLMFEVWTPPAQSLNANLFSDWHVVVTRICFILSYLMQASKICTGISLIGSSDVSRTSTHQWPVLPRFKHVSFVYVNQKEKKIAPDVLQHVNNFSWAVSYLDQADLMHFFWLSSCCPRNMEH